MRSTSMSSRALPEWGPHREAWWGCTERRSARRSPVGTAPRGMVGPHREALGTALATRSLHQRSDSTPHAPVKQFPMQLPRLVTTSLGRSAPPLPYSPAPA